MTEKRVKGMVQYKISENNPQKVKVMPLSRAIYHLPRVNGIWTEAHLDLDFKWAIF